MPEPTQQAKFRELLVAARDGKLPWLATLLEDVGYLVATEVDAATTRALTDLRIAMLAVPAAVAKGNPKLHARIEAPIRHALAALAKEWSHDA